MVMMVVVVMVMMVVDFMMMMRFAGMVSPSGCGGEGDSRGEEHRNKNFLHHVFLPLKSSDQRRRQI